MIFNFSKVVLKSIEGKVIENANIYKTVGNLIYNGTKDLGMLEIARTIYVGSDVDLSEVDVAEVTRVINDPNSGVLAFARKAVLEYIASVQDKDIPKD